MSELPNKKALSERDICTKYITPSLVQAKWEIQTQIREEVTCTNGRVIVLRKDGKARCFQSRGALEGDQ